MKTITVTDNRGTVIFREPELKYHISEKGYLTITSFTYGEPATASFGTTKTLAVYAPGFWHNLEIE